MSHLAEFFKGADTRLGVFYPEHYLIAVFPDLSSAKAAQLKLRGGGFSEDEVTAVPGTDLAGLVKEESEQHLLGSLMTEFSRFLHTEAAYTDDDLKMARRGAAILAVLCPDDRAKKTAWTQVQLLHPMVARYYGPGGIEHLAGET